MGNYCISDASTTKNQMNLASFKKKETAKDDIYKKRHTDDSILKLLNRQKAPQQARTYNKEGVQVSVF